MSKVRSMEIIIYTTLLLRRVPLGYLEFPANSAAKPFWNFLQHSEEWNQSSIKTGRLRYCCLKNPTGFNQSLRVALEHAPSTMLFVLNDRIPDGTDVSWIYDVDFEQISEYKSLRCVVSGDRVFDMALRLQYAGVPLKIFFHTKY